MKKLGWLFCFAALWIVKAAAQPATSRLLTGSIRDSSTNKPISYATVSLLDTARQTIASTYTQENGSFKLAWPVAGRYYMEISFVGYKTRERRLDLSAEQSQVAIGVLLLHPGDDQLQAVRVTARKRLVDQKPGMLVYNAENDVSNKGGTAADVLRKAPILNVDAQGNASMRGSSNLKILVNGKYSGQMARSAADALNMMPADMIKSVEVITTPSAKYDAEGAAGVINIITRKGRNDLSGTLEASASNLEQMLNPRLTYTNSKWSMNLAGHVHRLRTKEARMMDRTSFDNGSASNQLQQRVEEDNAAPHGSADLSIGYTIDESNELNLGVNAWLGKWPNNNTVATVLNRPDGAVEQQYGQDIDSRNKYLGADINLGYSRRFKRNGQQLTLQVQNSPSRDRSDYDARQINMGKDLLYREVNNSKTNNREWTFQVDYTHPLNAKGTAHIETGTKAILRQVDTRYEVRASDPAAVDQLVGQPDRSDKFTYSQNVVAGYAMYQQHLKGNWFVEAGARVEATRIKGNFVRNGNPFSNVFLNFVPTATLTKKLDESNTLTLSYTKRLTRPYIWDLNPNVDASDPRNIESGNPLLQPEIAHQAEFSYGLNTGKAFFLNVALFWRQTDNAIIEFMETNATGISYTSKQNLAANRQYGLNLSATMQISEQWTANSNVNLNYFDYSSGALDIFRSGWGGEINVNTTYRLPNHYSLQAFGEYNTRQVTLLGEEGRFYYYSFAAKKEIKKAKLTVTLAAVNPFHEYASQTDTKQRPSFISRADNRYYNRAFKLTVGWEFGRSQKPQKERKKIDNNDINVQGKG